MDILDLPPEILDIIINEIYPEDIDSFTSCCRTFYTLSEKRRATHKDLIRRFSKLTIDGKGPNTCIFHTLKAVQQNPIALRYCREFEFEPVYEGSHSCAPVADLPYASSEHREMVSEIEFADMLDKCEWLNIKDRATWEHDLRSNDEGKAFTLLLAFLPNLRSLTLQRRIHYQETLETLLAWVRCQEVSREDDVWVNKIVPLQNLKVLRISDGVSHRSGHLGALEKLLYLPNLKIITCSELKKRHAYNAGMEMDTGPVRVSPVEYLELRLCNVPAERLLNFLKPLVHLREFRGLYVRQNSSATSPNVEEWTKSFRAVATPWIRKNGFQIEFGPIPPRLKKGRLGDFRRVTFRMWRDGQVLRRAPKRSCASRRRRLNS